MAGQLVTLLLILRVMAAVSDDLKPIEITIAKVPNGFSVMLDWENECLKEEREVTFSAVYKKLGAPDNESQTCEIDEECSCSIPSPGLDHSHNYTLLVTAKTPSGKTLSNSQNFDPNQETKSAPKFSVTVSDALVIIAIKDHQHNEEYNITLRRNDSAEETSVIIRLYPHIIPLNELLPEQTYCVKVSVYCIETMALSPFSPEECFTTPAPGLPSNLAMNALDLTYLLKWDWDFDQSPNATFFVEKCLSYNGCTKIKGCENITTPQCDCSGLNFIGKFILRVSVYDGQRKEKSASTIRFSAREDTNFGPPKELKMQIIDHNLFINVTAPDGFRHTEIYNYCPWLTNLSYWINATHDPEVTFEEKKQPFFTIHSLKKSTTYCAKAKMACKNSNRSSLYSEVYCITTGGLLWERGILTGRQAWDRAPSAAPGGF
ncbi:interferon alpha/beta receptor 1 isoform 2-T2 [Anomaloglossus baeobatrachus]|uniref:interferon alpha/beta receptor 1 isoform X2 n=1 Tax=Anomaloglossus baeobatrachus TaxID=238106 RepID=UPI003F4FFAD8